MDKLRNYIGGQWVASASDTTSDVINPANQEVLARVPFGPGTVDDVGAAVEASHRAFLEWREVPVLERVRPLYKLRALLEENQEELARTITMECGKTLAESKGEFQRALENVEVACGMPMLMQSEFLEDVASGIDEFMIRQPLGVMTAITPFNFPGMIAFWFLPYAIACGNGFIVKPSEKVPLTMMKVFELLEQIGLPEGLVSLVHGGKETVDSLIDHPLVKGVSFVGSSAVARYVYGRAGGQGKRAQAQGGAKNPVIILPDADLEMATKIVVDSVFGCAGQRCLAASNIVTVGDKGGEIRDALVASTEARKTGFGLDAGVEMGPVITGESRQRIEGLIAEGIGEGATALVDGRDLKVDGFDKGNFVGPTILENPPVGGKLAKTEVFGPVMNLIHLKTIDEAIDFVNSGSYGNMACLFTESGANARAFRHRANAGNIGINIGVAAPMAQFPFSGWNESFFGDLHGQARHAVEFFTQTKVVVERWPNHWSRQF